MPRIPTGGCQTSVQSIGRVYTLTDDDKAALSALGVYWQRLLAQMNAQTVFAAKPGARNYAAHYVNPTGRITRPVLTLHTNGDWLATPNHKGAYRDAVRDQGNLDLLGGLGGAHCTFTPEQYLAGIDAMMYWLDTGTRPDPSVFFAPTLGFDLNYVLPQWP